MPNAVDSVFSIFRAAADVFPLNLKARQYPIMMSLQNNPILVPGSGQATGTIELPGDCDIQIDNWNLWTSDASWPTTTSVRVGIYYGQGDFSVNYPTTNLVRGELFAGTGQRPGTIGYRPWWINTYGNRGVLSVQFTNLATATTTAELCLLGHSRKRG